MILEILLGLGATALAISNSKQANENARLANSLNADTQAVINSALSQLNTSSARLSNTLRTTTSLKERALVGFAESFVYYLQHINSNLERKPTFNDEIIKLQDAINNYQTNMNQLVSQHLDQNTMLVSAAAGGLVVGAGALGMSAVGVSLSVGLGLSFFGVGSLLASAAQVSKTQNALEEAKYLNANKYSLKSELKYKARIVDSINTLFTNYNNMLLELIGKFGIELSNIQRIYKKGIVSSKKNMKLIAKGKQPVFNFEDFSQEEQNAMHVAVEKCKVLAEFARTKLLFSNGTINYSEVKKIGVKYE